MSPEWIELRCDILILGSGGAGLMAALHAYDADPKLDIIVAAKGLVGKSGCTQLVQGGFNAALDPRDSPELHFQDTVAGGQFLNDQELAWVLVSEAPDAVRKLETKVGCFFDRGEDGLIHQKAFAGQSFDRTVHRGDLTGIEIIGRLRDQLFARRIQILDETRAVELLHDRTGARIAGALLLSQRTGAFILARARVVLLATGGGPRMYTYSAPSLEKTGDGYAMAYVAGCVLIDMEMMQFHPTGLLAGASRLSGMVLEEGLRGAGARLFNARGERFMARYDPVRLERATRDLVARASYLEITAGRGTPAGGVLLDASHLGPAFVARNFPGMVRRCAGAMAAQPDEGEARQAQQAARAPLGRERGEDPFEIRAQLQRTMWEHVGLLREQAGLERALAAIGELEERAGRAAAPAGARWNLTWQQVLDVRSLLTAARLTTTAALHRRESRGSHARRDFPDRDDARWLVNVCQARGRTPWTEPVRLCRLGPDDLRTPQAARS